jgi:RNA polymerase sigma-32 factor
MNKKTNDDLLDDSSLPTAPLKATVEPIPKEMTTPPLKARTRRATTVSSRDIIPYDPLAAYLREIRRIPRLTLEEEHDTAVQYYTNKDLGAAYRLLSSNLWLVVKIARDYERAARNILDLIQEGNIGLMEAVKNFDPYRGVRFPSYASWWIKAYIVRFLIANWRMVKIGTTQAQRKLFFNLNKEKERLEREGFNPEPKLIAQSLGVKESEVLEMEQRLSGSDVSFDAPLATDGETTLLSILPSEEASAEEALAGKQFQILISEAMDEFRETLNIKEQAILERRLLSEERATLNDLAEEFSISRERIRQIEQRIKEKYKKFLEDKFGKSLEEVLG